MECGSSSSGGTPGSVIAPVNTSGWVPWRWLKSHKGAGESEHGLAGAPRGSHSKGALWRTPAQHPAAPPLAPPHSLSPPPLTPAQSSCTANLCTRQEVEERVSLTALLRSLQGAQPLPHADQATPVDLSARSGAPGVSVQRAWAFCFNSHREVLQRLSRPLRNTQKDPRGA